MRMTEFRELRWKPVLAHGSQGASLAPLLEIEPQVSVVSMRLSPHGVLGMHPAAQDQLLIVMKGEGVVSAKGSEAVTVTTGHLVYWHAGEQHETRAGAVGFEALVVEGRELQRAFRILLTENPD